MMPLGKKVDVGPDDIVLDEDQLPPKGHSSLIFGPYVCCGQTAGYGSRCHLVRRHWVDLGPGLIVLDGAQLPPETDKAAHPLFWAHVYCGQTTVSISATAELLYTQTVDNNPVELTRNWNRNNSFGANVVVAQLEKRILAVRRYSALSAVISCRRVSAVRLSVCHKSVF